MALTPNSCHVCSVGLATTEALCLVQIVTRMAQLWQKMRTKARRFRNKLCGHLVDPGLMLSQVTPDMISGGQPSP